jgi:4-amino-4-deoxy-L-arabinose transferase-like glycosyltransferase
MQVVQWALIIAGTVVQVLLIAALVRGSYRDFPFLFAYALASFLATAVEVAAILDLMGWSRYTYKYYWINDAILQILIVFLVFSLMYVSLQENTRRPFVMRMLGLAAVAVASISLAVYWDEPLNRRMTNVARNLSFGAVLLNMALWMSLIRIRLPDRRVLLISGALGIQMAGQAIGHSLRQLATPRRSVPLVIAGNLVIAVAHVMCLYLWWQVLRKHEVRASRMQRSALEG